MTTVLSTAPTLRSSRLELTPVGDTDVGTLVRHWGDEAVARYLWKDHPVTLDTVNDIVTTSNRDFRRAGYGLWALRRSEDELIGVAGLRQVQDHDWVELMFSLRPRYWGQGFATEAAATVLRHAFGQLRLERVVAAAEPENTAALRILQRFHMASFATVKGRRYWSVNSDRFRMASERPVPPSSGERSQ